MACAPSDFAAWFSLLLVSGDTWQGATIRVSARNPDFNPDLPVTDEHPLDPGVGANPWRLPASSSFPALDRVLFQLHTTGTTDALLTLDSDVAGEIVLSDTDEWIFVIEPAEFAEPAGTYDAAIGCIDADGGLMTIYKGEVTLTAAGIVIPP
jgi:hypothetical protein